jgi:glycosyltransferase involved in cell wall biosynthesis
MNGWRALVPAPARRIGRSAMEWWLGRSVRSRRIEVPAGAPVVCVGDVLECQGVIVRGGAVKLISLAKAFPGDESRFNVLYLTSSVFPRAVTAWIDAAKRAGAKVVLNQNGVAYPAWARGKVEELNRLNREIFLASDSVVFQTNFCQTSAEKWLNAKARRSSVIINPIDCSEFSPRAEKLPLSPLIILAAGSHDQPARVEAAVLTVAELRAMGVDAKLSFAGRVPWDPQDKALSEMLAKASITEHFRRVPPYSRDEAKSIFQNAHFLIHPKYKDPCPTVVLEALACGLPVIGSNSGGMPELVSPDCGALLPVEETWESMPIPEPKAMARAISDILPKYEAYSSAARARALTVDESHWIEQHRKLFGTLLAS